MFHTRDLSGFVNNASDVLKLKFVDSVNELGGEGVSIRPEFTHQVFGEKETIFGYRNLSITLYYTPDTLDLCVHVDYGETVTMDTHGVKPDNIFTALDEWLPKGYCRSLDAFSAILSRDKTFTPPGHLLHSYSSKDGYSYFIYKGTLNDPEMKDYLSRMQPLLLWFIEAASYIDERDERWQFYILYRQVKDTRGLSHYYLVGFSTVYLFYHYPDRQRPRISQFIILPHHQRQGHGASLLHEVTSDLSNDPATYDITVEDPSEGFVRLRDFIDCQNALRLPMFQPPNIYKPFNEDILSSATASLKLYKTQVRRVYEILRLKATDRSDVEEYRAYRLLVKNRLNAPHQREEQENKRLCRYLDPAELALAHPPPSSISQEEHITRLHEAYLTLEDEYRTVIERLAMS